MVFFVSILTADCLCGILLSQDTAGEEKTAQQEEQTHDTRPHRDCPSQSPGYTVEHNHEMYDLIMYTICHVTNRLVDEGAIRKSLQMLQQ